MDKVVSDESRPKERLERILTAFRSGVILLDANREIAWVDERTAARLNGDLENLAAKLRVADSGLAMHCCLYAHEVTINGEAATVCVVEETNVRPDQGSDPIAVIEAAMADASWFTRAIVEKLKSFGPARPPAAKSSDLDMLSDREREVLAFICEGRSDAQMGAMLNLSQNTIRNHIASLYRKIGVNRRSGAIIWARERGITAHDALQPRRRVQLRSAPRE